MVFLMHEWRFCMRSLLGGGIQRQQYLRGEHALLVLPIQIAVIFFHHPIHPHQAVAMLPGRFCGQITTALPSQIFRCSVNHIEIKLSLQDINVDADKALALLGNLHTCLNGVVQEIPQDHAEIHLGDG